MFEGKRTVLQNCEFGISSPYEKKIFFFQEQHIAAWFLQIFMNIVKIICMLNIIFMVVRSIQVGSHATRAVHSCCVHCLVLSVFFVSVFPSTYLLFAPQFFVVYIYIHFISFYIFFCYCSASSVHSVKIICCFVCDSSSAAYLYYNSFLVGIYIGDLS